jgi:hypothetical protein
MITVTVELTEREARNYADNWPDEEYDIDSNTNSVTNASYKVANAIRAALPIDQPGLYGVVTADRKFDDAGRRDEYVRSSYGWVACFSGSCYAWESLENVTLIREGI